LNAIRVKMFGPFSITGSGDIPFNQEKVHAHGKAMRLLAFLILHHDRAVQKSEITVQIWGGGQTENNTDKVIGFLKNEIFGRDSSVFFQAPRGVGVRLQGLHVDLELLDRALAPENKSLHDLCIALDECQGPLLMDWSEDEWVQTARREYDAKVRRALKQVVQMACDARQFDLATHYLLRLRHLEEPAQELHEKVMQACIDADAYAPARQLYLDYRDYLQRAHRLMPPLRMTTLFHRIPQVDTNFEAPVESQSLEIEPVGGALSAQSRFYCVRESDKEFHTAIARRDATILVCGCRQVGKSSQIVRGVQQGVQEGMRVVVTDLQSLDDESLQSKEKLFQALTGQLYDSLSLSKAPEEHWNTKRSENDNLSSYLKNIVLSADRPPLIWFMDEVDRLFEGDYRDNVFGLFRSWHNARSVPPSDNPFTRLMLVMSYSTEARLFITNLNQSPFNVGTRIELKDFSRGQVEDLCKTHRVAPDDRELDRLMALAGGHPYLVRQCLYECAVRHKTMCDLEEEAHREVGLFHSHLERLYSVVATESILAVALIELLQGSGGMALESFLRLRAGGIVVGSPTSVQMRCGLYDTFFRRRLL
jgi:DNA-binding SARP family transcriptional activator